MVRAALLLSALTLFAVSAGGAESATARKPLKVGLVADVAVLNDRTAGHSIYLGLLRAVKKLGVTGRVLTPSPKEGFSPSLAFFARQKYDAVIVAAFAPDAVARVAPAFPRTTFILPDQLLPHSLKNVRSLIFREEQIGYLVGFLAALMETRRPGKDVISSVGGGKYEAVGRFIAGFQAGARKADPGILVLNGYSNDFIDPRKCEAVALHQIARGSGAVFAVAGGCGFGALRAARDKKVWGIGVDTDQSYLGPHILTSAVKREDVAVFDAIRSLRDGSLPGGGTSVFTLANGGLALGRISPRVPAKFVAAVERVREQIVSGRIARIPTTVS